MWPNDWRGARVVCKTLSCSPISIIFHFLFFLTKTFSVTCTSYTTLRLWILGIRMSNGPLPTHLSWAAEKCWTTTLSQPPWALVWQPSDQAIDGSLHTWPRAFPVQPELFQCVETASSFIRTPANKDLSQGDLVELPRRRPLPRNVLLYWTVIPGLGDSSLVSLDSVVWSGESTFLEHSSAGSWPHTWYHRTWVKSPVPLTLGKAITNQGCNIFPCNGKAFFGKRNLVLGKFWRFGLMVFDP